MTGETYELCLLASAETRDHGFGIASYVQTAVHDFGKVATS